MGKLNGIVDLIKAGEGDWAYRELAGLLQREPSNKDAWWLMLALVEGHSKKSDCYRQILNIDPDDAVARAHLDALWKVDMEEGSLEVADEAFPPDYPDRCPNCGGNLEIHLIGELKDKWAVCPYCQTSIDIPDAYRRIEHVTEEHERKGTKSRVETTVIETRGDQGKGFDDLPPDIKGLLNQAAWKEPLEARQELMEKLRNGSIAVHHIEQSSSWMDEIRKIQPGFLDALKTVINPENMTLKQFIEFMEIAERTGKVIPVGGSRVHLVEALPTDDRINCPECDAVISKYAETCQWCSVSLNPAAKEI